jgi:hypothetical protein
MINRGLWYYGSYSIVWFIPGGFVIYNWKDGFLSIENGSFIFSLIDFKF